MPRVCRIAGAPSWSIPVNTCGTAAALIASTAVPMLPSGRFFIPIGIDRPDDNCRCTWLSTVRAPIAPHPTVSAMYCGVIGSRNSQPTGRPRSQHLEQQLRGRSAGRVFTSPEPSRPGSLIRPFQPRVERGFSKYTRITTSRPSESRSATGRRRSAYSRAAFGVVHRAGADDDQQAVVDAVQDVARPGDRRRRSRPAVAQRQLVVQRERRDQRDGLLDPSVDDRWPVAAGEGVHRGTFPPADPRTAPAGNRKGKDRVLASGRLWLLGVSGS